MMTSKLSNFQLEFMLDTMNQYSAFSFAKRKERYEGIKKIIKEERANTPSGSPGIMKNKTYERIMKESIKSKN